MLPNSMTESAHPFELNVIIQHIMNSRAQPNTKTESVNKLHQVVTAVFMNHNRHLQFKTAIVLQSQNVAVLSMKQLTTQIQQIGNAQTFPTVWISLNMNQEIIISPLTESVLL